MSPPLQVLIAEDDPADAKLLLRALHQAGFQFDHHLVDNETDYLNHLHPGLDIILSDYSMPEFGGLRALALLKERELEIPFLIISGTIGEDLAVAAMKQGAADYLLKDRLARLGPAVEQAIEQGRMRKERSKSLAALRESEERFREVVQNIEEVFWMTDVAKGEMLFISAAYEKIWGRTCESLYASPTGWLDAIHPEDRERVLQAASTKQATGSYLEEYRVIRPDGTMRWIRDRAFPVRDVDGNVYRVAGVAEDVTKRKEAEKELREQAAMLDLAHDAIIVRGFRDLLIRFWNKGAEHIYGWSSAEAVGKNIGDLIFVDPEKPTEIAADLLKSDEWRGENRHVSKDGTKLIVSTRATLVRDAKGEPDAVLVINTDITSQKLLEGQFLRAQRMESIGTLASGVAHDLNNILAPILMSAPLLRLELQPEQRDNIIETIEMSAQRGAQIVKQVLTFGRGLEGERRPLSFAAVAEEVLKIVRETFPKDLSVVSTLPPDLWPVVGDATQLHQVLLNLCVNARDAMPEGGRLELRAANLHLDESYASMLPDATPGANVVIEVTDSGSGIPSDIIDRIFDPFFTTKGLGLGTGLGLSTVMGIVKSHRGHINVTSHPDHGTIFQIYLPALEQAAEHALHGQHPAGSPRGQGQWVLVVDDEERIRRSTQIALEAHGYSVLTATDGAEALALFTHHRETFAVVLTDLMMPHMDGVAMIHVLRKMKPGLPIIASTGLGRATQLAELDRLGIAALLNKPYGTATLLEAIHHALTTLPAAPQVPTCT